MKLSTSAVCGYTLVVLISGAWGCSSKPTGIYAERRAALAAADDLGLLVREAGLAADALPSGDVSVERARQVRMLLRFALADGNMRSYGPRVTLDALLAEVLEKGAPVPRKALNEHLRRFGGLAVLRPDGYLALALTGEPMQCIGPVRMQGSGLQAGDFKLGSFYAADGSSFREDASLPTSTAFASGADLVARPK
jgi:hypothetical protein